MFIDITNMNIEINNKIYQCFYDRSNDYPYIILDNKRKYFKKCDKCKIIQLYGLKLDMIRQINKKSKCKSCRDYNGEKNPMYGKKHTLEIKEKISKINTGRILSDEHKEKISNKIKGKNHPMYGKKHTDESKNKIRCKHLGKTGLVGVNHPMYGKHHSIKSKLKISKSLKGKMVGDKNPSKRQDVRNKMRLSRINDLKSKYGQIWPNYNNNACKYFDKINDEFEWNLQHALNGGEFYIKELGYWVDAYDKNKNIVVEYDEPKHFNVDGTLKQRDIDRMINIINLLKCEFWRYDERNKKFFKISLQDYIRW